MKPLTDVLIKEILPAMRSIVAKKLVETYGLSQKQAALKLGMTQPAVSQYKRGVRGSKGGIFNKNPEFMNMLDEITKKVASNQLSKEQVIVEFLSVCQELISKGALSE